MSRITKVTPEAIAAAVSEIEREGNRPAVRAVQAICGGSTDVVTVGLKAFLDLRESARATLRGTGVFEAFDALCEVVHRHEQSVMAKADRKIEEGLEQIGPALADRDQAVSAQRALEAEALTLQSKIAHMSNELQQRETLVSQSRNAQVVATEQARLAALELAKCQILYQQSQVQLKEKKRELKDTLRRTEMAVVQQHHASEKQLWLKKELTAREDELRNARNECSATAVGLKANDQSALSSSVHGSSNLEAPTPEVQSAELSSLRAQVETLTEKNKALAAELQMAGDLIEAQAASFPPEGGQMMDVDIAA